MGGEGEGRLDREAGGVMVANEMGRQSDGQRDKAEVKGLRRLESNEELGFLAGPNTLESSPAQLFGKSSRPGFDDKDLTVTGFSDLKTDP
ncbi:pyruvate dehydrogenase E1 component subunit alpha [Pyrus ussuriensis x Pyrus communis]|uniref:Pyruvate dehydrogenase E1 component subunit alpha n=1 Tax=Pyrus ussuriensis x Pyrus communis TaxID=2448454 RepID=A0A5N5GQC5_9ROSA|nr:pyruvate dehydrogenase E1 component subunit alpha [Pyrus ussuriensis x Pyrus communis]